ncbi:hypothetical protein QAD02_003640 [Eretmocerus hayati]|uniref:Uncharacterized protein n=1 Tax=Eretmocerus hayati TaxID=131215 RepID=A0ACC2NMM3_9HYME|nr:hypothetical protein QAD02_003640 [Eretmocerus hayati]
MNCKDTAWTERVVARSRVLVMPKKEVVQTSSSSSNSFNQALFLIKKLPVSGEFRATAQNALRALKPILYQLKLANDLLGSDSDDDCPLVASTEVHSEVRREAKDGDLQIEHLAKDPMTAMMMMKLENHSIRNISTYPSSVRFWS